MWFYIITQDLYLAFGNHMIITAQYSAQY